MFDTLLDQIDGHVRELTDTLDVIEAVDKGQDAGGGQIPLVFVAVEVLD